MLVRVGKMPGQILEVGLLSTACTVKDALLIGGPDGTPLDSTGFELRVKNVKVTPDTILTEGAVLLLVQEVKMNS